MMKGNRYQEINVEIERLLRGNFSVNGANQYIKAASKDYKEMTDRLYHGSHFTNKNIQYPHQIDFSISDDPIFDASIRLAGEEKVVISVSLGILFSLDDLFTRLACNRDFYSQLIGNTSTRVWNGCECLWLYAGGGLSPIKRYYDYRTQKVLPIAPIGQEGTYLSAFYGGIPMEQQRIRSCKVYDRDSITMDLYS